MLVVAAVEALARAALLLVDCACFLLGSAEREFPALLVFWAYQQNQLFLEEGSFFGA